MRLLLLPSVLVLLWGLCPTTLARSILLEDMEASGDDLEGSGDELEEAVPKDKASNLGQSKEGSQSTIKPNDRLTIDPESQSWDGHDIPAAETSSFLENKDILAGVIGGGLVGLVLAALLAGLLIYKWQKKDEVGYMQGQPSASDQDYH